ncbi:MAG: cation diffusion facilitator family transporter [Flavobacteriia bacterium]|jgi:cation diffusion facilitator family transporter
MSSHQADKSNLSFQKIVVIVGLSLFVIKLFAWYLTKSVAIYSDALESIVNIISSFLGLYSLYLVTKPKDKNHPYGHGKVEFLSSAVEGVLITIAGVIIIIEAIQNLFEKTTVLKLDYGILLVSITALINFLVGYIAIQKGKKTNSIALVATGKHLITDTYSTIGIVVGLGLIYFLRIPWIDSGVAIIFSLVILYTGYKIIRDSVSGIMDEADEKLIGQVVELFKNERNKNLIDLHNLRIIKYGSKLHFDLHITLPYYFTVQEAHDEIENLDHFMNNHFGDRVELFIHTDPCMDFSCKICMVADCPVRKHEFERTIDWNFDNISQNTKHRI